MLERTSSVLKLTSPFPFSEQKIRGLSTEKDKIYLPVDKEEMGPPTVEPPVVLKSISRVGARCSSLKQFTGS